MEENIELKRCTNCGNGGTGYMIYDVDEGCKLCYECLDKLYNALVKEAEK